MNTITNEESSFPAEVVRTSFVQTPKTARISGILSVAATFLAIMSIFVPFISAFLYWNFLLISATFAAFGFLEFNSGKNWFSTIVWLISFVLLFLLFIFAFGSFEDRQSYYFYGAFSIIVPILMMISGLTAKNSAVWKSFTPLLIPAIFIVSLGFLSAKATYSFLLLLPVGWGLLGILNYSESKN